MPRRPPTRTMRIALAIEHLDKAQRELQAIDLRHVSRASLPAYREARHDTVSLRRKLLDIIRAEPLPTVRTTPIRKAS